MRKILSIVFLAAILTSCASPAAENSFPASSAGNIPSPGISEAVTSEPAWSPPSYPEYTPPPVLEEPSCLPQGLIDLVAQAIESDKVDETLGSLESSRSISDEELLSIMDRETQPDGLWDDLRYYVDLESGIFEGYIVLEADGDNDGILDIIVITTGGSAGNTGLEFFQGQAAGGYQKTYDVLNFLSRSRYGFLTFEEKQYFWSSTATYETKSADGLSLYEFQNGVPIEEVNVFREVDGYDIDMQQGENVYIDKLTQKAMELWKDGFPQFAGTAEWVTEDPRYYWGDLDNDGTEECYFKIGWLPTTFWDVVRINFQYEYEDDNTGPADELLQIMSEHGYAVQTLWCDKEEQGNIVYTVSRDTGNFLSADAWQYQENHWNHLAQVLYAPQYTVKTRVYTQDLNIDFLDTKAFM